MNPVSHKTVFVLDEAPHFVGTPTGQPVDLERSSLPVVNKTLWTSAVESITEYCRIVWDIFPDGQRVISFARCRKNTRPLLTWTQEDQTLNSLMKSLIETSKQAWEENRSDHSRLSPEEYLLTGLRAAVSILSTETPYQSKFKAKTPTPNKVKMESLNNKPVKTGGRIVCVSYFLSEQLIKTIQDAVASFVSEEQLDNVDLVLLHTHPWKSLDDRMGRPSLDVIERPSRRITPNMTSCVESSPSGVPLSSKVLSLVLFHYDLASTTVTGIPMKEEQNASSSANYDVEIVHPKIAHNDLFKSGIRDIIKIPKEGCEYSSIPLKWCTPRSSSVELTYSTAAVRLTPVDVNSRPSSCLTNFLLSGRTVMLEMPRKKIMSHMLSSHENELFIHGLSFSRTILEDPPSISEGSGGRVTDYRINDFGMFMKLNKLTKCSYKPNLDPMTPSARAQLYLERQTAYWPLVYSNSMVFNVQNHVQELVDLIPNESLTPEEVAKCKACLYQVVSMESKGTPLPALTMNSSSSKSKSGPKRDEQYKMLFKELAHFISVHCSTKEHRQVLHSLLQLTNMDEDSFSLPPTSSNQPSMPTLPSIPSAMEVDETTSSSNGVTNVTESSRELISSKRRIDSSLDLPFGQESLLSFWKRRLVRQESTRHPDFEGRRNQLPLYYHLNQPKTLQPPSDPSMIQ